MTFVLVLSLVLTLVSGGLGGATPLKWTNSTLGYDYEQLQNLRASGAQEKEFAKAAIASDADVCAGVAKKILQRPRATIADATVAAIFCYGAVRASSSGIGGGMTLIYYQAKTKKTSVLIAREMAPAAATPNMFRSSSERGKTVAVPGEVKGLMELYAKFGGAVPWADLVKPAIDILRSDDNYSGHNVTSLHCTGHHSKCPTRLTQSTNDLANTLQQIANTKGTAFYDQNHALAKSIVADIKDRGGIITMKDLTNFKAKWVEPVVVPNLIKSLNLHTAPPPCGGGPLMTVVLRVLKTLEGTNKLNAKTAQYIVEGFKHAFGARPNLGDPDDKEFNATIRNTVEKMMFSKDYLNKILRKISPTQTSQDMNYYTEGARLPRPDHGTAAFAIVGANGDAIALTTTVNYSYGAFQGSRTGIHFNNQMNDFSTSSDGTNANRIKGGKRPLSSATPAIFVSQNGQVQLATAGMGGIFIPAAVTSVVINRLYFGKSIKESIDAPRLHHILSPMTLFYEEDYDSGIRSELEAIGHRTDSSGSGACVAIGRTPRGTLLAGYDGRKGGSLDGF